MSTQYRTRIIIGVIGVIVVTMACAFPGLTPPAAQSTATATPTGSTAQISPTGTATPASLSGGGGAGAVNGGSGGGSGSGSGGSSGTGSGSGGNSSSNDTAPTLLPEPYMGPYLVKQIETLGGETISGFVCNLTRPFSVVSTTPRVTFTFAFLPQNAQQGKVSYAYSIQSAGESHDAAGNYSLSPVDKGGTLQLSLSVSDHVVFKGFDGNIPNRYKFNLVPAGSAPCAPGS